MTALFYVYDVVDKVVVEISETWPGAPRSVYRPVYWKGATTSWWKFMPGTNGEKSDRTEIHADEVPAMVLMAHMVSE